MAIIRKAGNLNVVEMARKRIINTFSNGLPIYLSMSGGKDSITIAHLIYTLIQEGEIDHTQLTVRFIDEEGIYPCIEREVKRWRKKFKMVGVKFEWYCIEVKHFNALNTLSADESFICWDRHKKDVWIRDMPSYAITDHELLKPRIDTYQQFLARIEAGGITVAGLRVAESLQRLNNIAKSTIKNKSNPIYDWKDTDVWKYLLDNNVEIPDVYLYYYQTGKSKRQLRVSQFFSTDTVGSLVNMNEFYPRLMERIIKREPNAYIVSLYWDTEMFRRRTAKRNQTEKNEKPKDYQKEVTKLLSNINKNFHTKEQRRLAKDFRKVLLKTSGMARQKHYRTIYETLLSGDPKNRTLRGVMTTIFKDGFDATGKELNK